jgi:hypothetical protein
MRAFILAASLLLAGCSGGEDVANAEKDVASFHAQLNAADFGAIHEQASSEWKGATSRPDAIKLFSAIHRKLGAFKSGKQDGWHVNYGTGGKTIAVQYRSDFEKGAAVEVFTFKESGEKLQMVGYNINSPTLITG